MKTKLIFPAFWTCSAPYLSIPSLAAYLKELGKDVEQIDLNLEFTDKMLSKDFLDICLRKYELLLETNNNSQIIPYFNAIGKYVSKKIDEQKVIMRSKKALDILIYERCCYFIAMSFALVNAAFPGVLQQKRNSYQSVDILLYR